MSALWRVEILEHSGNQLRLSLRLIHLDAGSFPLSTTFALRLLQERSIEGLDDHSVGPLGDAVTSRQIYDDDWMENESPHYIADVAVTDVLGSPFHEEAMREEVAEQTRKAGAIPGSDEWEAEHERQWTAWWAHPERVPSAVYTIRVTDSRWIAHLSKGQKWDSASYCGRGPFWRK